MIYISFKKLTIVVSLILGSGEVRNIYNHTMLKKNPCTFLIIFLCISLSSCSTSEILDKDEKKWLRENQNVTVAVFPYYAPYQFINDNERIDGILIDYLNLIEKRIDFKFQRKLYTNWEELLKDAENNKIDIILEIQQTDKKETYLNFYSKLFKSNYTIVTKKGSAYGSKLREFSNKTIVVPKGYGIHEILKEQESYLKIFTEIDDLTCLKKVSTGVADAYIGPKAVANYLIKTKNLNTLHIVSETPYSYIPSIAVQKNNPTLNTIIKKATDAVTDNDKEAILNNWLYTSIKPFYKKTKFWILSTLIIISIIIIVLFLNRYLKFLIRKKTKELIIAKESAEESNKLKTAFIHNISHEVRTPMNGIIGFSELLNDPELTIDKQKEYAKIVLDSSNRLVHIIEDIIEISNLHTEQIKVDQELINLTKILQNLQTIFENKAKNKDISISFTNELTINQNIVNTDKTKIQKILYNLIDNAIKFTIHGSIKVSCEIIGDDLIFSVIDTGIGIKQKDQELIFRNFTQSEREATKSYDGLGLGLSIARKYAQLLDGDISFSSEINQGSTFYLTLPYYKMR